MQRGRVRGMNACAPSPSSHCRRTHTYTVGTLPRASSLALSSNNTPTCLMPAFRITRRLRRLPIKRHNGAAADATLFRASLVYARSFYFTRVRGLFRFLCVYRYSRFFLSFPPPGVLFFSFVIDFSWSSACASKRVSVCFFLYIYTGACSGRHGSGAGVYTRGVQCCDSVI